MLFKNQKSPALKSNRMSRKLAALLLSSLVMAPVAGVLLQKAAAASDLESIQGAAESDGHFVRIGLNKSIVIRLPAEAHDVIVGNPEIVDAVVRSKNTAYLFARTIGQTNIFFFDKSGQQILNLDLEVAIDVTALRNLLHRSIPGTKITVDTVNNSVVLGGTAPNAAEAKFAEDITTKFLTREVDKSTAAGFVNTIKITGEDQVMLKVRVVEVQRDVLKQFGVDLQALLSVGKFAFNLASITQVGGAILPITPNTGYKGVYTDGANSITGVIRAMEQDGVLKTLAEPNLTAVSGQPAKFHAGGEYPYETCTGLGADRECTVTFRDFGVSLGFTPVVLSEGRINLKISTEVSELSSRAIGNLPILDSRSTETVVELPSGGSMMLAGLIKDTTRQLVDGTPGLKKLPVLGALFRSRDYKHNQTELVVIVTPYLVGSVAERQLSTPIDRLNTPTDRQTILLGRLNKVYGTAGQNPDGVYHGNVGFIVE
ncbi:MAG: type II and III secretion system protein family protein [Aestuariivirga sp.]|nr:type II and III secretion system protein family protein [Aestuariivirga sp.]